MSKTPFINPCRFHCLFLLTVISVFFGSLAYGRVFLISDTNDTIASTSLRGAIIEANKSGRANLILLQGGTYQLTLEGSDEDAGGSGDLDITRGWLTIVGVDSNVTINGAGLGDRVFHVFPRASLTLSNLVITGTVGATQHQYPNLSGEPGGAIYNGGILLLRNCIVTGNSTGGAFETGGYGRGTGGDGGGVYNIGILLMEDCTISGNSCGPGTSSDSGGNGGGVANLGLMLLNRCVICGNSAGSGGSAYSLLPFGGNGGSGGGIFNSGRLILNSCTISNNLSGEGNDGGQRGGGGIVIGGSGGNGGDGGGIFNVGNLKLNFCTLNGNRNGDGGDGAAGREFQGGRGGIGGNGAGMYNGGTLNLNTCTISGNTSGNGGNGANGSPSGGDGGTGGRGGGIYSAGQLETISCTVSDNSAGDGGNGGNGQTSVLYGAGRGGAGGLLGNGGGVFNAVASRPVKLRNTLIALNRCGGFGSAGVGILPQIVSPLSPEGTTNSFQMPSVFAPDVSGGFKSQKFNLIGKFDCSTGFIYGTNADIVGDIGVPVDPLLGPLQMNGGLTPTCALLPGSPAIDHGKRFGVNTDQRGHRRPHDYTQISDARGGDASDIGAFELDTPTFILPGQIGSLQVTISPFEAVVAGAQWRVDGGVWQSSGAVVTGLPVGNHYVFFSVLTGWGWPEGQTVSISANRTTILTGTYGFPPTGSVQVTILPIEAVNAGAQWQVDQGTRQDSDQTVSGLSPGNHTITFKTLSSFATPTDRTVTIIANTAVLLIGIYPASL